MLRVPSRRERVRHVGVDDRDPRLRQVGHRAEPLDHVVQLRRLVALDDLRAGGGQRDLVGRVVLEEREPQHDHEHRREPDLQHREQNNSKDDVQQAEQGCRQQHPQRETGVASV
jgi:site-specific DNA-cytosine methylase